MTYPKMTAREAAQYVHENCTTEADREMQRNGATALYTVLPEWDDSAWTDADFAAFHDEVKRLAQ